VRVFEDQPQGARTRSGNGSRRPHRDSGDLGLHCRDVSGGAARRYRRSLRVREHAAAEALRAKVPEKSNEHFALIERQFADGRPWVHGEQYTASDPYLFVFASYLRRGDRGDPGRFPAIMAHRARVRARPAVERVLQHEGLAASW
jgi:glutathione S-transferase